MMAKAPQPPARRAVEPPEILLVPKELAQVACDGGGGALGHPKVWYTFDSHDEAVCGYCDRLFTKHNQVGAKPYRARS
jgi:uncharacterized Zn-finger protein